MSGRDRHGDPVQVEQAEQIFRAAIGRHREGKLDEAVRLYRTVLDLDEGHFDALNNLGTIRARQGSPADAERLFRRALKRRPESADAHHNLAMALRALDRAAESEQHRQQASLLRTRQNAGAAAAPAGTAKPGAAEAAYRETLARDPGNFEALHDLGRLCFQQKRFEEAVSLLNRAVRQNPLSAEAHNSLAAAFESSCRYDEAIAHYGHALAIKPEFAPVLGNLGNVLISRNRLAEALPVLERAIALQPDLAAAHSHLGRALEELGRLDEARRSFERAIALAPRQAGFYRCLADVKTFSAGDAHLAAMEALAREMAALEEDMQIELHFALGKAYADVGEHERSFRHLLEGNRLKRKGIVYDEAAALRSFERIKETFTAELMRARAGRGDPSPAPVFILGMPRSGSTLVEQILASHPRVFGAGEIMFLDEGVLRLAQAGAREYPELMATIDGEQLRALGADYVAAVRSLAPAAAQAARVTDKLPANFLLAGLIHLALPNARIIHTVRDPVDTCLSCFSRLFAGAQPHCYELGELGRHYRAYRDLMQHWRTVLPPGVMLEVQYEELVADLESQARRLLAHCGLEWDEACLAFHRTERPVSTSSAAQVRQPLYRAAVGRARPYAHLLQALYDGLNGDSVAPGTAAAHDFAQALAAHEQGELEQAAQRYQAVLAAEPDHADALSHFARLRLQQGRLDEAAQLYLGAVHSRPNAAEVRNNLATVLCMQNRHADALPHLQQALVLRPDYPEALANLGNACFTLDRLEESVAHLRRAIALRPAMAAAHRDLGRALHALGMLEEARLAYENAIALNPGEAAFYRSLADFKRFTPGDPHIAAMEQLSAKADSLPESAQLELHFALGKAYADVGRHGESFQHLLAGNGMMRRLIDYDEAGTLASFERIQSVFTPALMQARAEAENESKGDPSSLPLFIIGMPRSGTTLIEQILASHPRVWGGGELMDWQELVAQLVQPEGGESAPGYPECVPALTAQQLRTLGADYCRRLEARAVNAAKESANPVERICDKMPANFLLAGLIPLALPNARIIHVNRNPVDTCLSCFSILFLGNQPFSYDLAELGRYFRAYRRLMEHWRQVLPPGIMLEVQYEDVVADLDTQARRIVSHCGLAWDDACLDFHRTQRPVWTASSVQVRQPLYRSSLGRAEPYRPWLEPLLSALAG